MEFKGMDEVDEHELKLMALRCFLIGLFGSFVVSAIIYLLMKNIIYAEITFVGSFLGSAYFAFIILKRDWLDKKIGLFDSVFSWFFLSGHGDIFVFSKDSSIIYVFCYGLGHGRHLFRHCSWIMC